jgi:hypothetical protein
LLDKEVLFDYEIYKIFLLFKVFGKPVKGRSRESEYVYGFFTPLLGT